MAQRFVTPAQRKRRILRDALLLAAVLVVLALRLDFPILTAGQAMEAAQARYFFGPGEVIDRIDFPRTANTVKGGQHDRYYILRWGDWYAWCGVDRYGLFWQAGTLEAVENDPDTPLVPLVVSDWEEGAALVVCNRPDIASVEVEFPVYAGSRYLLASIVQDQKTEDHFLVPWALDRQEVIWLYPEELRLRAYDAAGELVYQSPVPESWADDFGITDPDSPSARYTPA